MVPMEAGNERCFVVYRECVNRPLLKIIVGRPLSLSLPRARARAPFLSLSLSLALSLSLSLSLCFFLYPVANQTSRSSALMQIRDRLAHKKLPSPRNQQ